MRTKWLVHKDAQEGRRPQRGEPDGGADGTATSGARTAMLVEHSQRGAASSAYEPGPYSPFTEGLVEKFSAWYIRRLAEHVGA
ncbi:SRPBCC family protein [Cupriavidus basilensis]